MELSERGKGEGNDKASVISKNIASLKEDDIRM
jgi:hypothetical protein